MTVLGREDIVRIRTLEPERIAQRLQERARAPRRTAPARPLLILAADHPARGALAAGARPTAMADRGELVARLVTALARPGVDGFLGTADLVEELTLLGALEGKIVLGSMNRGGLAGAAFELDDRFTGYDAAGIAAAGLDGGKMLLRLDGEDPSSVRTLEACAHAVDALAERRLIALVEPFLTERVGGRVRTVLTPEAVMTAIGIASGLGRTSAYTWLKVPVVDDMERVMAASPLPALLLGGEVPADPDAALAGWARALALPTVAGLVVGRTLLFPPGDDVAAAVDAAVGLL
ncbi:Cgl0159 family (beta/alpha)8-fold protein [Georgenia faecalis]|uniref:Deoxyribose-phosphate aldolase n=1 Tax=Georgenia faecalis TaxID=2483799 RepID=A0ABV9DBC5_9MICO|nr:deoxyribose-phosphate aldolase [Georgenia faecalis]